MRVIALATVLAAALGRLERVRAGRAIVHHNFCLKTGSAQECAYDSIAQCEASKRGNTDFCMQNSPPQNH